MTERMFPAKRLIQLLIVTIIQGANGFGQGVQIWNEYMLNYPFAKSWNIEFAGTYTTSVTFAMCRSIDA